MLEIFEKFYSNDFVFNVQLIANAYIRLPLYELKWVLFKSVFLCKIANIPFSSRYIFTTIMSFQMKYCTNFYLNEYQKY